MDPILGINTFGCKTIGSKTVGLIPWTNHKISHVRALFSTWKCVNFSLHESAWTFLFMKRIFLSMKVHELLSPWKERFSSWKCVNVSLHERNFSLHESEWNFLYMKGSCFCMKVRELFSTWKSVNQKITLLHYNLSSEMSGLPSSTKYVS